MTNHRPASCHRNYFSDQHDLVEVRRIRPAARWALQSASPRVAAIIAAIITAAHAMPLLLPDCSRHVSGSYSPLRKKIMTIYASCYHLHL